MIKIGSVLEANFLEKSMDYYMYVPMVFRHDYI